MNADERRYKHQALTRKIIGVFFAVHNEMGFGFLESVYRTAMWIALRDAGLEVCLEFPVVAHFRGRIVGRFQADLVVNGAVIVELKAVRRLVAAHKAQTLNYLRASVLEVALLLNFGPKPQIRRLAFSNQRKHRLLHSRQTDFTGSSGSVTEPHLRSSAANTSASAELQVFTCSRRLNFVPCR